MDFGIQGGSEDSLLPIPMDDCTKKFRLCFRTHLGYMESRERSENMTLVPLLLSSKIL